MLQEFLLSNDFVLNPTCMHGDHRPLPLLLGHRESQIIFELTTDLINLNYLPHQLKIALVLRLYDCFLENQIGPPHFISMFL